MFRYFIEVSYHGSRYSGFQIQENAVTIQSEVEKALQIYFRKPIALTGSSRTDAGVHALQNYFHFDVEEEVEQKAIYNWNSLLPGDIAIHSLQRFEEKETEKLPHCRFDAISRRYRYFIYSGKDPFLKDRAYYFPYRIDQEKLEESAAVVKEYEDFATFSKRKTQVKNFTCRIMESFWREEGKQLIYEVRANRFLRGMVRGLVGTMLQVGRGKISIEEFRKVIEARDCAGADFSAPAHGLFLVEVEYGLGIENKKEEREGRL